MIRKIFYSSKLDKSEQPAMFLPSRGGTPRPLLVGLHTWSYDHSDQYEKFEAYCRENDWNFIYPDFRGPNWNPEACGSDFVVSDLEDAVRYACENSEVDSRRVYLCGGSGGGHCSLLMAGRRPDLWTAVSSWCPITDIARWHEQSLNLCTEYAEHIESACGGDPRQDAGAKKEAMLRSPLNWLKNATSLPLAINCGIHDGHLGKGSVPIDHSIAAFNLLAEPEERISESDTCYMLEKETVPEHLRYQGEDPAFGEHRVLLQKISRNVRLIIFEGGHQLYEGAALEWLSRQSKGTPVNWSPGTTSHSHSELTK